MGNALAVETVDFLALGVLVLGAIFFFWEYVRVKEKDFLILASGFLLTAVGMVVSVANEPAVVEVVEGGGADIASMVLGIIGLILVVVFIALTIIKQTKKE
ncbi:MAG: hypothetical protein PHO53_05330 [Actinomycetota bacterium]|nr:hypothetical protein [Actinomycetota bacterium]